MATLCLVEGCVSPGAPTTSGELPPSLLNQIEYRFVGDRGETNAEGWTLLWVADLEGDLSGQARWYFLEPNPIPDLTVQGASIAYYEARWEVRVSDRVILAGRSSGKTVTREGEDGIWDGHGVVTSASASYQEYLGRHTYETGPVVLGDDLPWGRGLFTIH
ncbi:MAG: hypothetical protein HKN72_02020 [Gemmatimonadetes bacterium]|nr:hypothetical protein [Gemmatimonadota bacterium]NNF11969.1 hypothetical protein [Gemmatimonadota bacterium]NNL29432.1 hypothetical protein [Gemmatimonadota bacterium]